MEHLMEQTLILIKPDGVQRGFIGPIISRFETKGLKLIGMKFIQMSDDLARRHYSIHQEKSFFEPLVAYIVSAPVVAMVWEGSEVVAVARTMMGKTNPALAEPGTIRGDFGMEIGRNLVHGSDSLENAKTEISLFFGEDELLNWQRDTDRWIRE
jgi:nucleoside-diphosphate kinase